MTSGETQQSRVWTGDFGRDYTERNRFESDEAFEALYRARYGRSRGEIIADWLDAVPRDARILEIGANVGNQLRALQRAGFQRLVGIEIQRACVEETKRTCPGIDVIEASALDVPFKDGFFDLVFTNNVLIHMAPGDLPQVMAEMTRVSRRWIWGCEYYAPELVEIPYRGQSNLLWKADYPRLFQEGSADLTDVRVEQVPCLDEPGNLDVFYLLEKTGTGGG